MQRFLLLVCLTMSGVMNYIVIEYGKSNKINYRGSVVVLEAELF